MVLPPLYTNYMTTAQGPGQPGDHEITYTVEVRRSAVCSVQIKARTAEQAAERVNQRAFPLPDFDEWEPQKDWSYVVYGPDGEELLELSR
jgi:hypothetical protein